MYKTLWMILFIFNAARGSERDVKLQIEFYVTPEDLKIAVDDEQTKLKRLR